MSALRELQQDFAAAMFLGEPGFPALLKHCGGDPGRIALGIEAYRGSVLNNLAAAVQATYPVIENIVGKDFLAAACHRYVQAYPSKSGDLNAYGDQFADFLCHDEGVSTLPYLADVARLEWLIQQVFAAEDAPAQDLSRLATTPPENWGELRFQLDPALDYLLSRWPVVRIWEINQAAYQGDFEVDFSHAETALIYRRPGGIAVEVVSPGEHALLLALDAGDTLADAVEQAVANEGEFDLQAALQRFIGNGLLRFAY